MREVSAATTATWLSGNFVGDRRAMARVTIQHPQMDLYDLGYNVYASLLFGANAGRPVELPNVKSVKWSRGVDTDVATGTLELYNTAPQELGTTFNPSWGVDQPGYYSYAFDSGNTFNPTYSTDPADRRFWQSMIVPDQILRTYEGYGFDPATCPENDPNLYQTGVWLIKDVAYDVAGLITVQFEDLGSILRDQIAFYPVIPKNFYPLQFTAVPKTSGFTQGYTVTKTVDSGGNYDPKHPPPAGWTGPLTAPTNVHVVDGPAKAIIAWDEVPALTGQADVNRAKATLAAAQAHLATIKRGTQAGNIAYSTAIAAVAAATGALKAAQANNYRVTGYQIIIDNVRMGKWTIPYGHNSITIEGAPLVNGNVYQINVVAIYERMHDGHQQAGNDSAPVFAHPFDRNAPGVVSNIITDDAPPQADIHHAQVQVPGVIGFDYTGAVDTFQVVVFNKRGVLAAQIAEPQGTGRQFLQTGLGSLAGWAVLIYPVTNNLLGKGALYSVDGTFLQPPVAGAPPHAPSPLPKGTPTITKKGTAKQTKTTVVLDPVELAPKFSNTSNTWYVGAGENVSVYGHTPHEAMDDDDGSYWLSIGNISPDRDFAFEWFEVTIPNQEVSSVRFHNKMTGYFVYLSVFAKGTWVHHDPEDIIPYNAKDPISHNGGNIPYCETLNCGKSEGPFEITLRASIPGVTKVRLTFHNLQDFGIGRVHYRAALRKIKVYGITSSSGNTSTGGGGSTSPSPAQAQDPKPGPVVDDNDPSIVHTYTVYIPPKETPGAGEEPGKYEDYTDIVKLICAWAGFYWPPNATLKDACGSTTTYDWGPGLYGLKNVDPVLGGQDSGRVWGDFMDTGTAGIVNLPIPQWDKKSLLDCISYVRDIMGYLFYIDEQGAAVWRLPNVFSIGNYVGNYAASAGRSSTIVSLDERTTLIDLKATLSSRNVRERYFIASTDGKTGALAAGFNPNPVGLRRVGGWTDQHFASDNECQIMADMVALNALMTYRVDTVQIAGYPGIQVDDQVRITEKVSGENFLHYVRGIGSSNDLESGVWTYDLNTNWLGTDPFQNWIFERATLSSELQQYLAATANAGSNSFELPPSDGTDPATGGITTQEDKVAKFVKEPTKDAVYITDGITKRHVNTQAELKALVELGVVSTSVVKSISAAILASIPDAP